MLSRNPLCSQASAKKNAPNAPNMNTSPWAKLIMRRIPYTSVYPSAIIPMMAPWARPRTMKFFHVVAV